MSGNWKFSHNELQKLCSAHNRIKLWIVSLLSQPILYTLMTWPQQIATYLDHCRITCGARALIHSKWCNAHIQLHLFVRNCQRFPKVELEISSKNKGKRPKTMDPRLLENLSMSYFSTFFSFLDYLRTIARRFTRFCTLHRFFRGARIAGWKVLSKKCNKLFDR